MKYNIFFFIIVFFNENSTWLAVKVIHYYSLQKSRGKNAQIHRVPGLEYIGWITIVVKEEDKRTCVTIVGTKKSNKQIKDEPSFILFFCLSLFYRGKNSASCVYPTIQNSGQSVRFSSSSADYEYIRTTAARLWTQLITSATTLWFVCILQYVKLKKYVLYTKQWLVITLYRYIIMNTRNETDTFTG